MEILRTPDACFANLKDYPFEPNYCEVSDNQGGKLRVHYIDEGPEDAAPVLLMHGEPSWSYLYRKMIPIIAGEGFRVIAPDLVGFGRSDKPARRDDYTYARHVNWMQEVIEHLELYGMTLVCQDWGGLIGLRLVANSPERFARVVAANTGLPTGDHRISEAFLNWRKYSVEVPDFNVGAIISMGCRKPLSEEVTAAYNAPFPDDHFKEGARIFPSLVPITPDDPATPENHKAWDVLSRFEKPFLTAFSDSDPITAGGDRIFQKHIPGAKGQPHTIIKGGGHFLQEDCGEELAWLTVKFIDKTLEK